MSSSVRTSITRRWLAKTPVPSVVRPRAPLHLMSAFASAINALANVPTWTPPIFLTNDQLDEAAKIIMAKARTIVSSSSASRRDELML